MKRMKVDTICSRSYGVDGRVEERLKEVESGVEDSGVGKYTKRTRVPSYKRKHAGKGGKTFISRAAAVHRKI